MPELAEADELRLVAPDGLSIRRRRHEKRWSPRELVHAIAEASFVASGRRETIIASHEAEDLVAENLGAVDRVDGPSR